MKKTITIGSTLLAGTLSMTFIAPNYADAAGYYYWHKGDMDDSTVLKTTFKNAINKNGFTYDGVNINTEYGIFKRVMKNNQIAYKKLRNGVYQSRNATFIFSLKNNKLHNNSKLRGIYFKFDDYAISTAKIKKVYGTPANTKRIKNGLTYTYKAHYNIKNKFDFVKSKGSYKLTGFMTTK
ncbi:hypothetical protein AB4G91_09585 [Macrococcoides goetzii]|uniref:hypothetical protein n=1 Tax=Macrococcus TaxID=69965 RepID=UPI001EF37B60|nr:MULTISPECIES: hypothetical protein [Macrococcus]MCG7419029.1 hypothetical protein [Macrococcus epidermidis]MCH4985544.1 hypothetical protein [Macrococcus sp. PK]UTH16480.1 hypothetical protein KFV12_01505 [Macrococcus epidermidis]